MHFNNKYLIPLFSLVLAQRLVFILLWLQDWDSVQFALGMKDFNVVLHQPHPPGYPLYLLLANFLNIFVQNNAMSLSLLSAITGALLVIPLYFLAKKMFNEITAIFAIILYSVLPVSWMMSEAAASNIPGLFFLTSWVLLAYLYNDKKIAPVLGFMAGLIMGVRASDFPIIVSLVVLLIIHNFNLKYTIQMLFMFFIGLGVWLIPTALITGAERYLQAVKDTSDYVRWHDTLLGQSYPLKTLIRLRLIYLWNLLSIGFTLPFLIFSVVTFLSIFKSKNVLFEFKYQILLTWFGSYFIALMIYYNLELAQYTLPLIVPLVIFTASVISKLWQRQSKIIAGGIIVLLVIFPLKISLPQVIDQSRNIPVTVAPVIEINHNFQPQETTIVSTFLYRQFQYYAPEFKSYYGAKNVTLPINTKYVVLDYLQTKDQIRDLKNYQLIYSKVYQNQINQFSRLKETKIYVLERIGN